MRSHYALVRKTSPFIVSNGGIEIKLIINYIIACFTSFITIDRRLIACTDFSKEWYKKRTERLCIWDFNQYRKFQKISSYKSLNTMHFFLTALLAVLPLVSGSPVPEKRSKLYPNIQFKLDDIDNHSRMRTSLYLQVDIHWPFGKPQVGFGCPERL